MGSDPWEEAERELREDRRQRRKVRRALRRLHLESYVLEALDWGRVLAKRQTEEESREMAERIRVWMAQDPARKRSFRRWLKRHPLWKTEGMTWALLRWYESVSVDA